MTSLRGCRRHPPNEEPFPDLQREPLLSQLEAIPSGPITLIDQNQQEAQSPCTGKPNSEILKDILKIA